MSPHEPVFRLALEPAGSPAGAGQRAPGSAAPAPGRLPSPERMPVLGLDRRSLTLVALLVAVCWLVFVFGRAVADSEAVSQREAALRVGNAAIADQLQAREAELAVVQSDAFVALQARAFGLGTPQEQVFALSPGTSPAPELPILGKEAAAAGETAPLDAWLNLLFGT